MIRVNGVEIADSLVLAEMQYHPAASAAEAEHRAGQALLIRELLRQRAAALGLAEDGDIIEVLLEREVEVPEPDDASCRRYAAENPSLARSPDLFEARHILLAAAPDDDRARVEARTKAAELIGLLAQAPDRFADLAAEHSDCPSKARGGHLGQILRGSTVPEFETFLLQLDPGQLSPVPVPTRYGYHVLQLLQRETGRDLPPDQALPRARQALLDRAWRQAIRDFLTTLVKGAMIDGIAPVVPTEN